MGLTVNNNIAAMNAYRNLSVTNDQMGKSLEKLSSGYRINRAADDAAGLAISEGLRSQIGGLKVAVRNTQDGISVVQTAEGALTETHSILQRMRDLSVQASNQGSMNADALKNVQSEIGQLKSELDRIADTTTFNGQKLLDGNYNTTFQVGANAGETIRVNVGTAMGQVGLGVNGVDVTKKGSYTDGGVGSAAAGQVTTANADSSTAGVLTITAATTPADDFSTTGTIDSFKDLTGTITFGGKSFDLGSVKYDSTTAGDLDSSGTTDGDDYLAQLNAAAKSALGLTSDPFAVSGTTDLTFPVGDAVAGYTDTGGVALDDTTTGIDKATAKFTASSGAPAAIDAIDNAIKAVSTTRADLGAVQNR